MKYKTSLIGLAALLSACTSNHVQQITGDIPVAKLLSDGRYGNLYPGKKTYPVTCEDDCYPAHQQVLCETPGQDCRYTGPQTITTNAGFTLRWLGHASFVVHTPDGQQILLDPVSQGFDWPVDWAADWFADARREPGFWPEAEQLSQTRAVLYSHLHYDHFNKADIEAIGNQAEYFVGLGSAEYFDQGGYTINEMDWYASKTLGETTIHSVPAHHFNGRIWVPFLYDDNEKALWSAWLIEHQGKTLFFAGDTGYSPHFSDIHQRFGDIDICLIPVASYHHEEQGTWYRYVHTTPEDALIAAEELGCKSMIPWGYGNASWGMGDISSHSPLLRLLAMYDKLDSQVPLLILNEGDEVSL
ncbi:MBL fold metallo-hydrolase [Bowmanella pacifica]|uniref:Metallo-beta-lactamase domain-containing protein n=2 Tax=Bowmanella TaxID=366580 RepID=A0A918DJ31_9ALTE|nr:MBL fold metallo-hydrolase [Bowmanella pacifica]GGO69570.1 hypothetical protein GCM10010982_21030 [Bowmanella pacifica]